jgi:hypothetical protein
MHTLLLLLLPINLAAQSPQMPCIAAASAPALDHVVIAVRDLERAATAFRSQGFRIKQGRLHANNLLNRHIKFRDGTALELMTVAGSARDAMAQDYARLLRQGDAGVYFALKVPDIEAPARAAAALQLESKRSSSGPWQFLSFPPASPAATIFFTAGGSPVQDPDSLVTHEPAVTGLHEVWIEGGPELSGFLRRLGAQHCGPARSRAGPAGERWALRRGFVVVVPARNARSKRVLGVVLQSTSPMQRVVHPLPTFWIEYTSN